MLDLSDLLLGGFPVGLRLLSSSDIKELLKYVFVSLVTGKGFHSYIWELNTICANLTMKSYVQQNCNGNSEISYYCMSQKVVSLQPLLVDAFI